MKFKLYIFTILLFSFSKIYAQEIGLKISFNDSIIKTSKLINYTKISTLQNLKTDITSALNQLQQKGFLTSTTDSIIVDSSFYHIHLHLGKTYKWTSLTNQNIDEEILSKIGFRVKLYNNKHFNKKQLQTFFKKVKRVWL